MKLFGVGFIIGFIIALFVAGILTLMDAEKIFAQNFLFATETVVFIAFLGAVAYALYLYKQYADKKFGEIIASKEEHIQALQDEIRRYQSKLDEIGNLKDRIFSALHSLIQETFKCINSKQSLLDALRYKKGKELTEAIRRNTITEKGAQHARKKFDKLIDDLHDKIIEENSAFSFALLNAHNTVEEFIQKIKNAK